MGEQSEVLNMVIGAAVARLVSIRTDALLGGMQLVIAKATADVLQTIQDSSLEQPLQSVDELLTLERLVRA